MNDRDFDPDIFGTFFSDSVRKNVAVNYREYREKKPILASYPIKIYVEPTQRCNFYCVTCSFDRRKEKEDMPMVMFRRIEHELFPHVAEVNFFLTGEPTLAVNFCEMIKASKRYTFLPRIFTNGTLMSGNVAYTLVECGCFVNISFDAASPELFEYIRKGAKFDDVRDTIKKLQLTQKGIANKRFHLRLATTLGLHNIDEAPKIIQFAHEHDIADIMFGCQDSGGCDPSGMLMVDPKRSVGRIHEAIRLADKLKIRLSVPKKIGSVVIEKNNNWNDFSLPVDKYAPFYLESFNPYAGDCGYPWMHTAIRSNGLVVSCCQREHVMGDYRKDDFLTIWNNERYVRLRSLRNYGICLGKACNLSVYSILNGGGERDPGVNMRKNIFDRLWALCFNATRWVLMKKARFVYRMPR